jgi:hypothetical protein
MEPLVLQEGVGSFKGDEIPKVQVDVGDATSGEVVSVTLHGTNTPQRTREAARQRSKFFTKAWPDTSVPHQPLRMETIAQLSCRCQMGVPPLWNMGHFREPGDQSVCG